MLQIEGLVEKFQGRGNFVRAPLPRLEYPGADGRGLHVTASYADTTATGDLAARLASPPGTPVTEYLYVAHRDDAPHSLAHVYVPHRVAQFAVPDIGYSPWGDDVLRQLVTRAGVPVACETHQVTARFPTDAEAQSLRIATRTPVLAVERTLLTDRGPVAAYALLVLPGDRAQVAFATGDFRKEPPDGYDPAGSLGGARDERR
ncbi:GntR family transcriptional regulator [Streptomyces sp. HPF1205]|uniref:GntR family transcriptional regulator n=1 Tax=Streptomyces sp. HPF1205 TaxID=2873262 RepID=UPI0027DF8E00|nr:GntR family transcriptional regulator [Streptomyces sp. HPF1205]